LRYLEARQYPALAPLVTLFHYDNAFTVVTQHCGTALELAGQGTADPSSLYAAIRTCTQLAAQRKRG
ncbi:MAG TPA: hypothetical protein PKV60_10350, partial [Thermomonas sp.]|nr:hypothetical protein [Thermomonas sp.]